MIIKLELTDSEIREALKDKVKEKYPDMAIYDRHLEFNGTVKTKIKNKRVRKNFDRLKLTIKTSGEL